MPGTQWGLDRDSLNGVDATVSRYLAIRSQRPDHGEGQFVGHRVEAAQLLTQHPGEHGHYLQTEDRPVSTILQPTGLYAGFAASQAAEFGEQLEHPGS